LRLEERIGEATFGFDRYVNQRFYTSYEWKKTRDLVIVRDGGRDLGVEGNEIYGKILVHHMNPILLKDIETSSKFLMDPEFLITTTHATHNAIHFGDESLLIQDPIERTKNDTCPWRTT
jgi:hypothetical protein